MNFDQLIEYNMKNIFYNKSYTKCGRETIQRPLTEKSKLKIDEILNMPIPLICQLVP